MNNASKRTSKSKFNSDEERHQSILASKRRYHRRNVEASKPTSLKCLSLLSATPTFTDNHLYYSWNETTWEYLPDAVFLRNGSIDSNTHKETGATLTQTGSNTHNQTTANHKLTNDQILRHHAICCA